jgi:hypothetical protein
MPLGAVGPVSRRMKLSAIGANSVTLVPTTAADPRNLPVDYPMSQVVISTNGATPPAELWGVAITHGREYRVTIEPL